MGRATPSLWVLATANRAAVDRAAVTADRADAATAAPASAPAAAAGLDALRVVALGGEPCQRDVVEAWARGAWQFEPQAMHDKFVWWAHPRFPRMFPRVPRTYPRIPCARARIPRACARIPRTSTGDSAGLSSKFRLDMLAIPRARPSFRGFLGFCVGALTFPCNARR